MKRTTDEIKKADLLALIALCEALSARARYDRPCLSTDSCVVGTAVGTIAQFLLPIEMRQQIHHKQIAAAMAVQNGEACNCLEVAIETTGMIIEACQKELVAMGEKVEIPIIDRPVAPNA